MKNIKGYILVKEDMTGIYVNRKYEIGKTITIPKADGLGGFYANRKLEDLFEIEEDKNYKVLEVEMKDRHFWLGCDMRSSRVFTPVREVTDDEIRQYCEKNKDRLLKNLCYHAFLAKYGVALDVAILSTDSAKIWAAKHRYELDILVNDPHKEVRECAEQMLAEAE